MKVPFSSYQLTLVSAALDGAFIVFFNDWVSFPVFDVENQVCRSSSRQELPPGMDVGAGVKPCQTLSTGNQVVIEADQDGISRIQRLAHLDKAI